jgi:hypothetical protein
VCAVDERLAEIQASARYKIIRESLQYVLQHAVFAPALKAAEAGRVRGVARRHVGPRSAGAKHPEDAVEHVARVAPWTTATVVSNLGLGKKRLDRGPLLVPQIHRDFRSQLRSSVDRRQIRLNLRDLRSRHLWNAL